MRVIDAFDEPVRAAAVSPDGRFLAACAGDFVTVWSWGGDELGRYAVTGKLRQLAFTPDGGWLAHGSADGPCVAVRPDDVGRVHVLGGPFSGGVAVSPDGRRLVATRSGDLQEVTLEMWELPSWRPASGFDYWSPFERLAFSPSGEFLAGINREVFELRYAESGGLNRREERPREGRYLPARLRRALADEPARSAYLAFSPNSEAVVYGWDAGFFVMETRSGSVLKRVAAPADGALLDAAFTGSHLTTVDGSPLLRLWSAESWEVVRGYDWGAGGLTCVTAAADGLAGVCGSDTGRLVVFDVDE